VTHSTILVPMLALVGWTLLVLLLIPFRRVRAAMARQVTPNDFRYGESARVPPEVSIPNRAYMNLLEGPVMFYAVCLTAYVTQHVEMTAVSLAWIYVAARIVQSLIHLSYNAVLHRMAAFGVSNFVLTALWGMVLWDVLKTQ